MMNPFNTTSWFHLDHDSWTIIQVPLNGVVWGPYWKRWYKVVVTYKYSG